MIETELLTLDATRFAQVLDPDRRSRFEDSLREAATAMEGRTLFHVNSTATGGGVAELLASVLGYLVGAGVSSRWLVLEGDEEFFVVTKRIHHLLHGKEGDGGRLGPAEHEVYDATLARELATVADEVRPGDVVVLHDPQVVGLAPALREAGASVIWNCHVGADEPNELTRSAWEFLLPAATRAHAQVFSRPRYAWEGLPREGVEVIPPCIDAFSPKNQPLGPGQTAGILGATGLMAPATGDPTFVRADGTRAGVETATQFLSGGPVPADAPVVTQVSRWDPLKDHAGLALAFARAVPASLGAHLVLAGPSPDAVSDDPEGAATLEELRACVCSLPGDARGRVHIACLPMDDVEENGAIVNALQRRSDVVVQKSLAEGFGLTVAEAMWKKRPTVASAVGGIQDQICHRVSGILVEDPTDGRAFGEAITELLCDRQAAAGLGRAGHASVLDNYLAPTYLRRYQALIARVLAG